MDILETFGPDVTWPVRPEVPFYWDTVGQTELFDRLVMMANREAAMQRWINNCITAAVEATMEHDGCIDGKTEFLNNIGIVFDDDEKELQIVATITVSVNPLGEYPIDEMIDRIQSDLPRYAGGRYIDEWTVEAI